jgi:hypothetical protein
VLWCSFGVLRGKGKGRRRAGYSGENKQADGVANLNFSGRCLLPRQAPITRSYGGGGRGSSFLDIVVELLEDDHGTVVQFAVSSSEA